MTSYVIVRTALAKEQFVCDKILKMGFDAWVPELATSHRINRLTKRRKVEYAPVMSKTLLAAVPVAFHADLQAIRYYDSLQRDAACTALQIPGWQVKRFMDYLQSENDEIERLAADKKPVKRKKAWVKLEPASLADVLATMFGIAEAA